MAANSRGECDVTVNVSGLFLSDWTYELSFSENGFSWNTIVYDGYSSQTYQRQFGAWVNKSIQWRCQLKFLGANYGNAQWNTSPAGSSAVYFTVSVPDNFSSPTITTQPVSQSVSVGASVTFSVAATGAAPLYVKWRKNGVNIDAFGPSYTIASVNLTDAGNYSCLVWNASYSVVSQTAVLSVSPLSTPPALILSNANLMQNATSLTISGSGFSTTPANNIVVFTPTGSGIVSDSTATTITVTSLSGLTLGALNAVVTTSGRSSGAAVQVASVIVPPPPTVTLSNVDLAQDATILSISGSGFSATPGNNTVVFTPAGSGIVTDSTATTLTVTSLSGLALGALNAVVTTSGRSSGAAVKVRTVVVPPPPTATRFPKAADWVKRTDFVDAAYLLELTDGVFVTNSHFSSDGITWNAVEYPSHNYWLNDSGYGAGIFVMTGAVGQIFTSTDYKNWTPKNPGGFRDVTTVAYGNGTFIAREYYSSSIWVSKNNGATWTSVSTNTSSDPGDPILFGNGKFYVLTANSVFKSSDAINWDSNTISAIPAGFGLRRCQFNGERIIGAQSTSRNGSTTTIVSGNSVDGNTWTFKQGTINTAVTGGFYSVGGGPGYLLIAAEGVEKEVWLSQDEGSTWFKIEGPWVSEKSDAFFAMKGSMVVVATSGGLYSAPFRSTFSVTLGQITNGTITGNATEEYPAGSTATLTATPNTGYVFTGWTGDASGTVNPLSVLMDSNKTIGATFGRQYTLTPSPSANGTIAGSATGWGYLAGTTATLTATPSTGYVFTGWTGDAGGTANPLSILMDANKTIGATFSRQYTLTPSPSANGTIAGIATGGEYLAGTTATLTATPSTGYVFAGWTGYASGTANPLSVLIDSDKTIGATFSRQYILTPTPPANGMISGIATGGGYLAGSAATLTATPSTGYVFTGWTGDADGTANPLSVLMDANKTIGATFSRQYTLTPTPSVNGTITGIATGGGYLAGSTATLTATPSTGYVFTGWTGDTSGTANPLSVLIDSNKTIGATFSRQYTLTPTPLANGTISGIATGGGYLAGSTATLTATPNSGYVFTGWTGDAGGTANPLSVLIDSNKTIGATFSRQYTLTSTPLANGTISGIATGGGYPAGSTATLTATPNTGYVFTGWTGDASGLANPQSVLIGSDKMIGATFEPDLSDADGDGLSVYLELVVYGTSPSAADTDADGLTDGWEVGSGRFSIVEGSFSWAQARTDAKAKGGDLASFPDENRWNRALETFGTSALDRFTGIWIGASDAMTEGTWTWVNGEAFAFQRWAPTRPNTIASKTLNFAEIAGGEGAEIGRWYDRTSTTIRDGYLLEVGHATSPTNADTDADGLSDGIETKTTLSNPLVKDTNGNGVADADEDFDGDGFTNRQELEVFLTAPNNLLDRFEIEFQHTRLAHSIAIPTVSGRRYRVESAMRIDDPSGWVEVLTFVGNGTIANVPLGPPIWSRCFYRVRVSLN